MLGWGWAEAFMGLPMRCSKWATKGRWQDAQKCWCQKAWHAAGGTWHLVAFGCCWVWCMSQSWWMTFRSFPLYHICKKFPFPQMPFCSPTPELQMASTHASHCVKPTENLAILLGSCSWLSCQHSIKTWGYGFGQFNLFLTQSNGSVWPFRNFQGFHWCISLKSEKIK